jgi:hypothetical protein
VLRRGKLVGIVVTLVCLGVALARVDLRGLFDALAAANYLMIVPAAVCTLLGYAARTARWRTILAEAAPCRFTTLFGVLMIGFATNNVLPARPGELARAYLLRRQTGVRKTYLLASIFLERLFDGLVLVAILTGLSLLVDLPGMGREIEVVAALIFLAVAIAVVTLLTQRALSERLLAAILRPFPDRVARWTSGAFGAFLMGLDTMRRPTVLTRTALLSILVWSLEWSSYFIIAGAFPLGLADLDRAAACALLLAVTNLGIMLPSSPGYVGTFHFFATEALAAFGVPREAGLAVAVVSHLTQYVLVTSIGATLFMAQHLSPRDLWRDSTLEAEPAPVGSPVGS